MNFFGLDAVVELQFLERATRVIRKAAPAAITFALTLPVGLIDGTGVTTAPSEASGVAIVSDHAAKAEGTTVLDETDAELERLLATIRGGGHVATTAGQRHHAALAVASNEARAAEDVDLWARRIAEETGEAVD